MKVTVNVTLPKNLLKDVNVASSIGKMQRDKSIPEVLRLFKGTVEGWENKPSFTYEHSTSTSMIRSYIHPRGGGHDANVYNMVTLGTPPHIITPKRRPMLRFREGYIAATTPGSLMSGKNKRTGKYVGRFKVNHPGIKDPREFDKLISEKYQPIFEQDMGEAVARAVSESGLAI